MREDRVTVRVVVAPQQGICANEVAGANADGIVLECDVKVALPVLARLPRIPEGPGATEPDVIPVESLEHDSRPAGLELGDDELQAWVALAHARLDEVGDGEHHTGKRQRTPGLAEGQTVVRGSAG